jgi:hypothetical protein
MTVKAVWHIVKESARSIGVAKLAPHDLRRTCARLCHASGGELEQSNFSWGTFRCRRPNVTWAASSGFDQPSMIALASSLTLELGARSWKISDKTGVISPLPILSFPTRVFWIRDTHYRRRSLTAECQVLKMRRPKVRHSR